MSGKGKKGGKESLEGKGKLRKRREKFGEGGGDAIGPELKRHIAAIIDRIESYVGHRAPETVQARDITGESGVHAQTIREHARS